MSASEDAVAALTALGFTALEAEVYTYLLQDSPVTGYRVAQAIGRPTANTYKAIESLERRGAVIVDHGSNRMVRATPYSELLTRLEDDFTGHRQRAANAFSQLDHAPQDDRVYQLQSITQVLARIREMIGKAERIILLDTFPQPLRDLRADIEAAIQRDVTVALKVYEPVEVPGADVILDPMAEKVLAGAPGTWINLMVDGAEALIALLSEDMSEVTQSIWTASPFITVVFHSGLWAEMGLAIAQQCAADGEDPETLEKLLARAHSRLSPVAGEYQAWRRELEGRP